MNENHQRLCPSEDWARFIQDEVLPSLVDGVDLGEDMLEIGPGPGAATEWLRHRVRRLVAVEVDPASAQRLRERFAGTNVEVVTHDATTLDLESESFDSVGCFTMLHHVPTLEAQRRVLATAMRALRPGGVLVGSDSLASDGLRVFHEGDAYNPLDPSTLLLLLRALGAQRVRLSVEDVMTFVAYRLGARPPSRDARATASRTETR